MSKHEQTSADGAYHVAYGYDNPLSTYFLQVYMAAQQRRADEAAARIETAYAQGGQPTDADCRLADETGMILWLGTTTGELPTVEALVAAALPYVAIPAETITVLRATQASAPGPTALQATLRA